ncbi:MAG: cellulase family glycosylhydrolase [Phycisphaerae bacterium]
MRRRDFCKFAATAVATACASSWNRASGHAGAPDILNAPDVSPGPTKVRHASGAPPKVRVHPGWKGLVTADNQPFIPFGAAYFRPNTGWAPRLWRNFNAAAVRRDFVLLKANNLNTVRVFLPEVTFYPRLGLLETEAVDKFDQLLALAEEVGLYVQTCLIGWGGKPAWKRGDEFADPRALEAREQFWSLLAGRYKGRSVIYTYELANEPTIGWNTHAMQALWNKWNNKTTPIPPPKDNPGDSALLAFQHFREHVADEWTRRQVAAIKKTDPEALATIGLGQWSVPAVAGFLWYYTGFRPQRQAKMLDFMQIHIYPQWDNGYHYQSREIKVANLSWMQSTVREMSLAGLPTMVGEFGWYGGGRVPMGSKQLSPPATQEQQARFLAELIRTSTPLACGWLNWAMYDDPVATDITRFSGLFTAAGKLKNWGKRFGEISLEYRKNLPPVPLGKIGPRPDFPWDACLTSSAAAEKFRLEYLEAFKRESFRT